MTKFGNADDKKIYNFNSVADSLPKNKNLLTEFSFPRRGKY